MTVQVLADEMRRCAQEKLAENLSQIDRCINLLSKDQIWRRPGETSNAVGNLVLHLTGNVRQWIVSGVGGEPFRRDRPAEYLRRGEPPAETIQTDLRRAVERAIEIIGQLNPARLAETRDIQGYTVSTLAAVFHVVEHFSFHTGQIIYATKVMTGADLSLYDEQGRRLDGRREGAP